MRFDDHSIEVVVVRAVKPAAAQLEREASDTLDLACAKVDHDSIGANFLRCEERKAVRGIDQHAIRLELDAIPGAIDGMKCLDVELRFRVSQVEFERCRPAHGLAPDGQVWNGYETDKHDQAYRER